MAGRVIAALSHLTLEANWKQITNLLDDRTIDQLEVCSDVLHRQSPELAIEEEDLTDLIRGADDLADKIGSSNLEERLRDYLLRQVDLIRRALEDYQFQGVAPIHQAVQSAYGSAFVSQECFLNTKNTQLGKKFWEYVARLSNIASLAHMGAKGLEAFSRNLLS